MNCPACPPSRQQSKSHASRLHIGDGYWACAECSFGSVSLASALSHCFLEGHRPRGLRNRHNQSVFRFLTASETMTQMQEPVEMEREEIGELELKRQPGKSESDLDLSVVALSPTKTSSPEKLLTTEPHNLTELAELQTISPVALSLNVTSSEPQRITEHKNSDATPAKDSGLVATLSPSNRNSLEKSLISEHVDSMHQTARKADVPLVAMNNENEVTATETNGRYETIDETGTQTTEVTGTDTNGRYESIEARNISDGSESLTDLVPISAHKMSEEPQDRRKPYRRREIGKKSTCAKPNMNCPACPSSQQSNSHTSSLHIGDGYWACSECSFGSISLKSALSHCFAEGHRPRGLRNRRRESISRFLAACEMLSSAHDPLRIRQMDSKRRAKTEADCSVVLSPPKNNSRKLLPETERKTKELNVRKTDHDVSVLSPTKTNSLEPRSISQETNWTTQTQFETNSLIAATPNNRTSPGPEWQQITEQNTREVDFSAVSLSPIKMDIPQHVQISKQMDWPRQTARETDLPFAAENDLQGLTEPETNRTRSDNTFLCSVLPRTEFEQENDEPSVSVDPLPLDSVLEMTVNTMGTKGSKNDETVNKMICPNEKRTSTRIRTLRQSGKERTNPDHVFGGMSEQEHAEIVAFLINETYPDHVVYKFNYRKKCRQFVLDRFSLDENPILLYISKKTDKTRKVLKIGDVQTIVQAIHVENRHCRYGALFTHVADRFYWPNTMHVDICAVLNNCDECGKSKTVSGEIQIEHITYSPEGALNERRKISKHQEVSNADVPVDLSDAADEEMDSEQKARSPETSLPFLDLSKTKQENCSNKLTEAEDVMDEMSRSYATVIAYNNTDRLSPISAPESTPQNPCSSQTDIPVPTKQSKKNGKQPSSVNSAKKKRKTLVPDHVYGGMSEQKYTEITNYLKNETYPEQVGVKSKFRQRCRHFSLDEQQRLENISNQKCKPRRVLKVGEVQGILETIHIENRHCGYGTLTNHITRRFWWPNSIQADTCAILNSCDVCKKLKKRVGLMEMEKLLSYE